MKQSAARKFRSKPRRDREHELPRLTLIRPDKELTFTFKVPAYQAPALRAAIIDASNRVGQRMVNSDTHQREQALVNASMGLAALRSAVCAQVPEDDPFYWPRWVQHEQVADDDESPFGSDDDDADNE